MKRSLLTLTLLSVAFGQPVFLWPKPQSIQWGDVQLNLGRSFNIRGPDIAVLEDAMRRYTHLIARERWDPVQVSDADNVNPVHASKHLNSLDIEIIDKEAALTFGTDESYTLHISPENTIGTLKAQTVWGALRGLETFSQLVQAKYNDSEGEDEDEDEYAYEDDNDLGFQGLFIPQTPIIINDEPRFSHRGLMLDTSRNYYPVFHWHITDSQSFPLVLDSVPELAKKGAYRLHGKKLVYTKQDVRVIVKHAHSRGIRVIPEIDMPGHTGSWAKAFKQFITCSDRFFLDPSNSWEKRYAAEPGSGQLNPILKGTYTLVKQVIDEVTALFPDEWYHGGGDEPVYRCWEDAKSVRDYMARNNVTGLDLLNIFLEKELEIISNTGKTAMLWEDSVTENHLAIPKDVVIQVWKNPVKKAVKAGYKVIASSSNFWYLDCGHGQWSGNDTAVNEQSPPVIKKPLQKALEKYEGSDNYNPSNWGGSGGDWCSPFKSWQRMYIYDITYGLSKEETKYVLGGECALWSEQSDETTLDARLWPRAAATAEVLWSGNYDEDGNKRSVDDAMPRMFDWRYRLLKRGIRAEPLQPLWCGSHPHMCDAAFPAGYL
ncbi:glycoside hydrolase family 20 protein [Phycomyces blakesleeanus]|uniref:Beta-hexosaminidase n=1 Tax=Phycomyces blakesleeanus TaxID=4837 RepID=A0ABR3B577_PHYBL